MTLNEFFSLVPKAAVAFSGGTDSAFLLWAAREFGCEVRAYYGKTAFQPQFELEDARRLASELEVPMTVVEADILSVPEAAANGPQRCYHCKTALFSRLRQAAREDGYTVLLDGTNASDDAGDRPGMRALRELEVRSPLRECGLTKDEVRRRSREAGLFTWDKPAYACLATRIPTGAPHHQRGPGESGAGGRRPAHPGVPGLPGAALSRGGPPPGDGGTAAPGFRTAGGDLLLPWGRVRRGAFGLEAPRPRIRARPHAAGASPRPTAYCPLCTVSQWRFSTWIINTTFWPFFGVLPMEPPPRRTPF